MKTLLITFIMLGSATLTNAQQGLKVSPVVKATATASGQNLQYPQTDKPEIDSVLIEIAPGGETGLHMHRQAIVVRHLWEAAQLGIGESELDRMTFPGLSLRQAIEAFTIAAYGERLSFEHE